MNEKKTVKVAYITHIVGALDTHTTSNNITPLINSINKTGLKSKSQLIKEGVRQQEPVQGIFSDEHDNIYFWGVKDYGPDDRIKYSVKVDPDNTYVYNAQFRGSVDYFLYQASRMTLSNFLDKNAKSRELNAKITEGGLDKKVEVINHPLTAEPVLINIEQTPIPTYCLEGYGAEVAYNSNIIPSTNFAVYPQITNGTMTLVVNDSAPIINVPDAINRGIYLDDSGSDYYVPTREFISDDYGKIYLVTGIEERYSTPRYACNHNARVTITPDQAHDIISPVNNDYTGASCYQGWYDGFNEKIVIIADARNNTIRPDHKLGSTIYGKKGADKFIFSQSFESHVVVDYSSKEGDILAFPRSLYKTSEEVLAHTFEQGGMTIIPLGDLGSVVLAYLEQP
jgi:hypothetical protein